MDPTKFKEILEAYTDLLGQRLNHEGSMNIQTFADLFNRCQTLYLEKTLEAFKALPVTEEDNSEALRAHFANYVSTAQKELGDSALGYLASPFEDRSAPDSPANKCLFELFHVLYPKATTQVFLKVFFPEVTSVINFDEPSIQNKQIQIRHEEVSLSENINEHAVSTLIIKNGVALRVADILYGSPEVLCQYAELLRLHYPKHYEQLRTHNDSIQALYKQVALLNDSVTLSEAITRLRTTLRRYGDKVTIVRGVTNVDELVNEKYTKILDRAIAEFQEYLAQYGEQEAELGELISQGSMTLKNIINRLISVDISTSQCVEQADDWLEMIQKNAHNTKALSSKPRLTEKLKADIKQKMQNQIESDRIPHGRHVTNQLPVNFLKGVIAQIHISNTESQESNDQVIGLFEHFNDEASYEQFIIYNEALKQWVSTHTTGLLIGLIPQQQIYLVRILEKHQLFLEKLTDAWKVINISAATPEQASLLLSEIWQIRKERQPALTIEEIAVLLNLPSSERSKLHESYHTQLRASLTCPASLVIILCAILSPIACEEFCRMYAEHLSTFIKTVQDFNQVFRQLNDEQCTAVCRGCADQLSQIDYGDSGAALLVQQLTIAGKVKIFETCITLSIPIVPTIQAFINVVNYSSYSCEKLYKCFRLQLPGLIQSIDDFSKITTTKLDYEDRQDLASHCLNQLQSSIISAKDFSEVARYLPRQEVTKFYKASPERWLALITSPEIFWQIAFYVPDCCQEIYRACSKDLLPSIQTVGDARCVMACLRSSPSLFTEFCQTLFLQRAKLIPDAQSLSEILRFLTPEQCESFCAVWQEELSKILTTLEDFNQVFRQLNPEQCATVCRRCADQLHQIDYGDSGAKVLVQQLTINCKVLIFETCVALSIPIVPTAQAFLNLANDSSYAAETLYGCFRLQLAELIHSIDDFKKITDELFYLHRQKFARHCLSPFKPFITSANDLSHVIGLLPSKEVAKLYKTCPERWHAFITSPQSFWKIASYIPDHSQEIYRACSKDLLPSIQTTCDVRDVMTCFQSRSLFTEFYQALSLQRAKLIPDAQSLSEILRFLTPEQCESFCAVWQEELSKILTTLEDFNQVFRQLNPERCAAVCRECAGQLRQINYGDSGAKVLVQQLDRDYTVQIFKNCVELSIPIVPTAQAFINLLNDPSYSPEMLYECFHLQLPKLIQSIDDFKKMTQKLFHYRNAQNLAFQCLTQLKPFVILAEDFEVVTRYLSLEKAAEFYKNSTARWLRLINTAKDFWQVTAYLPDHCEAIYRACAKTLLPNIKDALALGYLVASLKSISLLRDLYHTLYSRNAELIPDAESFSQILRFLRPEQCAYFCTIWYDVLSKFMSTAEAFVALLNSPLTYSFENTIRPEKITVICEKFDAQLVEALPTPEALGNFLNKMRDDDDLILCRILADHIKTLITTVKTFRSAFICLDQKQRAPFYEKFNDLIVFESIDDLELLFAEFTKEQRAASFKVWHDHLTSSPEKRNEFVDGTEAFNKLMSLPVLTFDQRSSIYTLYRPSLSRFITSITEFNQIIHHLDTTQRTEVFVACQDRLLTLSHSAQSLAEIVNLIRLVNSLELSEEERGLWVTEFLKRLDVCQADTQPLSDLITNLQDFTALFKEVSDPDLKIYDAMQAERITHITSIEALSFALDSTPVKRCASLLNALDRGELLQLLPTDKELGTMLLSIEKPDNDEEAVAKQKLVLDFLKPILLLFFIGNIRSSANPNLTFISRDYTPWVTFTTDSELYNRLLNRFLTLYSESYATGWFKKERKWCKPPTAPQTNFFSSTAPNTQIKLPTFAQILEYAQKKAQNHAQNKNPKKSRTLQVLEQLVKELKSDFITKQQTLTGSISATASALLTI